ncbi:MAG: S8 family serine peptidase [candidate division NC10 bacterium]|nr:S8 family serine peptidase [candidate division NC10 bacterium]
MRLLVKILVLVASAVLATSGVARAALSVTASATSVVVGQPVSVTVSSSGCNIGAVLGVNFGDSQSTTVPANTTTTVMHAYSALGSFTIGAGGVNSGCTPAVVTGPTITVVPLSVTVSVTTSPSPAQVSQIQSVPVLITYVFTTKLPATLTMTSSSGSFISSGGDTLGTGGGGLSVNIVAGRGVVTETLAVPEVVAERSLRGGSALFDFRRDFSGSGTSVTATVPMRVVSSAVGPFSLRRVELRFENGRGEITIPKNFEKLKAIAIVEFNGSGLLEAAWEVDGRTLAIIREFLTFGSLVTITTPAIPPLPSFEPGLHRVAFRITSPPATFEIPTITYFVTAATAPSETIELIAPADRARLPQSPVTFEWKGVSGVVQYQIEITEDEGAAPVFSALATASPYRMPAVYERNFVTGKRYRWQVRGLDVAGNVVAFSKSRTFTWAPEPAAGTFVPRQVLAALKAGPAGVVAKVVSDLERRFTLRSLRTFDLKTIDITVAVFEISDAGTVGSAIFALQADRRVVFAQPNYLSQTAAVHTDSLASLQYGPRAIRADQAHDRTTGRGVRVAIVDTGIDTRQPDLRGRVTERVNFAEGEGAFEEEVHGTVVAGVIAATADNGVGIYGVAPEAELLAIRACRAVGQGRAEGLCTSESLARGIDYALLNGAKVINLSLGGPADLLLPRLVDRAVELGIVVVAAAGNAGPQAPAPFPAAFPKVIAVTAVDAKNGLYAQATRGEFIDLAAPGVEIMTTMPGERFNVYSGTSMAAAHVSGIVALLFQVSPRASPEEIQRILEATAEDLGVPGKDRLYGSGRVDACRAVQRLLGPKLTCR